MTQLSKLAGAIKKLPEITPQRYLLEIVEPTIAEFQAEPTSVRRAMLACIVTFHAIEYFDCPELKRQKLQRASPHFALVDKVAHAAKHRKTDGQNPLRAEEVLVRPPGVFGQAIFDLSRFDDPIGGVTIHRNTSLDILQALNRTVALLRSKLGDSPAQTSGRRTGHR